jgi:hypothetical protein
MNLVHKIYELWNIPIIFVTHSNEEAHTLLNARANATRCASPPDNVIGY